VTGEKNRLYKPRQQRDGALKAGDIKFGARFSIDHFESRLKGRTHNSFGKPSSTTYKGGVLFIDHSSSCVQCEHQIGFSVVKPSLSGVA
jgi:hypothetical protein